MTSFTSSRGSDNLAMLCAYSALCTFKRSTLHVYYVNVVAVMLFFAPDYRPEPRRRETPGTVFGWWHHAGPDPRLEYHKCDEAELAQLEVRDELIARARNMLLRTRH